MREVYVLVDWDNCADRRIRSALDAEQAVTDVGEMCLAAARELTEDVRSVQAWIYTAWSDDGRPSVTGGLVRTALSKGGRRSGRCVLTMNPADRPVHMQDDSVSVELKPMLESRNCRSLDCTRVVKEQKLVDAMIVSDAGWIGGSVDVGLVILSDDRDMVPGLTLAARTRRAVGGRPVQEILWFRPGCGTSGWDRRLAKHVRVIGGAA